MYLSVCQYHLKDVLLHPLLSVWIRLLNCRKKSFGPVLHVVTFNAEQLDAVVDEINAQGYGLTFGLHTRVNNRVEQVVSRIQAGNMYVNRNQIGAVVGSQPFGGEGMSGTGPKAGGPQYVQRFKQVAPYTGVAEQSVETVSAQTLQAMITDVKQLPAVVPSADQLAALADVCQLPLPELDAEHNMPGPTGETEFADQPCPWCGAVSGAGSGKPA